MMSKTEQPETTDRIEKRFEVRAPRSRVWRAVSSAKEFGTWFGVHIDDEFVAGARVRGRMTYKGEQFTLDFQIARVEPERYFSYRWHPYAIDKNVDYSSEPMTLVEFRLDEIDGGKGTAVTIVESGFDKIPVARRAEALRMNDAGWTSQSKKLVAYVA